MAKKRVYITIAQENDLRREFDELINEGRTNAATFHTWMKYSRHYGFDNHENKWYFTA